MADGPHQFLKLRLSAPQANDFELGRLMPGAGTPAAVRLRRQLCCRLRRGGPTSPRFKRLCNS